MLVVIILTASVFAFAACNKAVVQTDTETVVTVTKALYEDGDTLETYMNRLADKNKLSFTADNGMVTVINGIEAKAADNRYWMIYTSDGDYSNDAWGTYEYDGTTYGSATKGIKELPVKVGAVYVFAISQF